MALCHCGCGGVVGGRRYRPARFLPGHNTPKGTANNRFNGGLSTTPEGRAVVVCRDGTLLLYSRAVMASHLGRLPSREEIVHHVNEDVTDDRIENLEVTTRADHARHHHGRLSPPDVRAIREARANGVFARILARRYGVGVGAIYSVEHRRSWANVA